MGRLRRCLKPLTVPVWDPCSRNPAAGSCPSGVGFSLGKAEGKAGIAVPSSQKQSPVWDMEQFHLSSSR